MKDYDTESMSCLRWGQVDGYLKRHPFDASIIIPIGPVEEHGPHLPVGSDYLSAEAMARLVEKGWHGKGHHCLVFPTIPLMVCDLAKETTGTYSVRPSTLHAIVYDLVEDLAQKGFRKILFFTGHGGKSMTVVREAIAQVCKDMPDVLFKADILNFEEACPHQAEIAGVDERDIHAGGIETSRMLFLCPSLVSTFLPLEDYHEKDGASGQTVLSASGICGDPQQASPEKGRRIVEYTLKSIIRWFEEE